ncbi:MAG: hypothetical protein IJV69_06290 [Kiritimatiellae bacterium]|nr:hypothetical protein [Kiritimatiellia bacterium]
MAYINPRLRNPAEGTAQPTTGKAKTDWIGGACAIIAFCLAAATTAILYMEWDLYTSFIGR